MRWISNREAGDLRRYRAHYDVTVLSCINGYIILTTGHLYQNAMGAIITQS